MLTGGHPCSTEELEKEATCAKIAQVRKEGKRLFAYIKMQETNATNLLAGIR